MQRLAPIVALIALALGLGPVHADETHYKIGIIGAGNVGGTLGTLWAKAGDAVMFSSRHPDALKALAAKAGPNARTGTPAEAAAFGDVVLIAVPYAAFAEVAKANDAALAGKVVFDASNAVDKRDGAALGEAVRAEGIGLRSRDLLPGVHLVRGFNAISYKDMATRIRTSPARRSRSRSPATIRRRSTSARTSCARPASSPSSCR